MYVYGVSAHVADAVDPGHINIVVRTRSKRRDVAIRLANEACKDALIQIRAGNPSSVVDGVRIDSLLFVREHHVGAAWRAHKGMLRAGHFVVGPDDVAVVVDARD